MVTGGRRKMAIPGEESYCGRENSCIFNEELESFIVGPLHIFQNCLDMSTWETYEISTYFPLDGDIMREGSSLTYCRDLRFFCTESDDCFMISCHEQPGMECELVGQDENGCGGTCECNGTFHVIPLTKP